MDKKFLCVVQWKSQSKILSIAGKEEKGIQASKLDQYLAPQKDKIFLWRGQDGFKKRGKYLVYVGHGHSQGRHCTTLIGYPIEC